MTIISRRLLPVLAFVAAPVAAQQAMYTEAATMPSPQTWVIREQLHYFRYGENPANGDTGTDFYEVATSIDYGLARALSLRLDVPAALRRDETAGDDDWDKGVGDLKLQLKYRVYKDDSGGIDTFRIALLGGASLPSGDDHDFSDRGVSPFIGAVATKVWGRHGFNQDLIYTLNTGGDEADNFGGQGPSDALRFDTAYLYRFSPAEYTADSRGAWYVTAEVNGLYETDGDIDIRFAPGLMYEAYGWALEFMVQLPLYEDVDHRSEFELGAGLGLRFAF